MGQEVHAWLPPLTHVCNNPLSQHTHSKRPMASVLCIKWRSNRAPLTASENPWRKSCKCWRYNSRMAASIQSPALDHLPCTEPSLLSFVSGSPHSTNHRLGLRFKSPQHCKRPIFDYEAAWCHVSKTTKAPQSPEDKTTSWSQIWATWQATNPLSPDQTAMLASNTGHKHLLPHKPWQRNNCSRWLSA